MKKRTLFGKIANYVLYKNEIYLYLNEIKLFADFLISRLFYRQRPKCLIIFSSDNFEYNDEFNIINTLKKFGKKISLIF